MSDKDEKASVCDKELSVSSSNDSSGLEPVPLTSANYERSDQPERSRRRSSLRSSFDSIRGRRESLGAYSVKDIYGDLDDAAIAVRRAASRNTILSELIQRNQELEDDEAVSDGDYESIKEDAADLEKIPTGPVQETTINIKQQGGEFVDVDPELITWDSVDDPRNPANWSLTKKWIMILFVSLYALVAPMTSSMLSPAMDDIANEFHITNPVVKSMVVSIQILAWAIGPLIIAPLSEHDSIGRKIVLDVSVWMNFFFNLGCAFSHTTAQMMVFRFIGGLFGCVPMNVCAGVIADMCMKSDSPKARPLNVNIALAGYSLAPLLGPVIAPLISGFIVNSGLSWRWTFYVLCMFNGFVGVVATIFFRETYAPTLLKRKAQRLRKSTGNQNLHTIYELTDGETFWGKMWMTMTRPLMLLFTHPMIVSLGSLMAFTYGFMYLLITAFPSIFHKTYGYNAAITGLMYLPMGVGFLLAVFVWTYLIGRTYNHLVAKNNGVAKPEFRLPMLIVSSFFIPVGLIWFGWSAQKKLHWIMPGIGSGLFAFGLVCVFQSSQSYFIDMSIHKTTNEQGTEVIINFSASSVAAAAMFRSIFGFTFPLFAPKMYQAMGYGWANTMSGFIALLLIGWPVMCYKYGERIRVSAMKRIERKQLERDRKNLEKLKQDLV
ncbi:hypothetical protein DIURU_004741 [Diutina rugosa]|uniref:Major facilitator superfamily (MFS) profile domain-containing protein n=1 Tax=Diutina rugosa TaxID=5481 RepID=A0A642UF27_DIURU|nr:uncharacterized protein DIURU_004741 [Diutina rugosa]KAA8897888.1 hypothetical protein DIURU_004741 [Diutina rugosa]